MWRYILEQFAWVTRNNTRTVSINKEAIINLHLTSVCEGAVGFVAEDAVAIASRSHIWDSIDQVGCE